MDIREGSRAMLGSPVRYMDITKGYRAKLGCSVGYMDVDHGGIQGNAGVHRLAELCP
jgi:hypothetical protein